MQDALNALDGGGNRVITTRCVLYLKVHDSGHCSVTQLLTLHFPDRKRSCLFSPFFVQSRAPIEFSEERKVQYDYKLYYYIIGLN